MKKKKLFSISLVIAVSLIGCGKTSPDPIAVLGIERHCNGNTFSDPEKLAAQMAKEDLMKRKDPSAYARICVIAAKGNKEYQVLFCGKKDCRETRVFIEQKRVKVYRSEGVVI